MSFLPEQPQAGKVIESIAIDSGGNAYTEFTREKESIIRAERLDSMHPVVTIDLESILTEEGGSAVAIVVQDFGLPPRLIGVAGDFTDTRDILGQARHDKHYQNAPKTLLLYAKTSDGRGTYTFDEKGLPRDESGSVELSRGESMLWAHDGSPSDERPGYIGPNSWWELVALKPHDYFGSPDFSDLADGHYLLRDSFVPFVGISYVYSSLSIYSLDDVHAEVLYQQVRSLDEQTAERELPEHTSSDIRLSDVVEKIKSGDSSAQSAIETLINDRAEAFTTLRGIQGQLIEAQRSMDNLETVLAGNKTKLREARAEAARLAGEVQKLQREGTSGSSSSETRDSLFDLLGGRHATEADPHSHCSTIGLDPNFLFALAPDAAKRVVRGVHRGLVMQFHSDRTGGDDEAMKRVNAAVDSLINRLETGYWGRH